MSLEEDDYPPGDTTPNYPGKILALSAKCVELELLVKDFEQELAAAHQAFSVLMDALNQAHEALGTGAELLRFHPPTHDFQPGTKAYEMQGGMMEVFQKQRKTYNYLHELKTKLKEAEIENDETSGTDRSDATRG